ncbi:MAG: hypothetical protein U5R06_11175 [candidate division KSB1 bacterium]|nr:hypothetical protein [candidate division KSB1 bacterium]
MQCFKSVLFFLFMIIVLNPAQAEFKESFQNTSLNGWSWFTGDGAVTMDFVRKDGYARIKVDATQDRHNVWWAIIKRNVADDVDMKSLQKPGYELRVEAKVRLSCAPRRINFMVNTQRTTNFHKQLREYDIADTTDWHVISMTTQDFDAVPGDSVFVQLGVTDWGVGRYHVDLDYYRARVLNVNQAEPDAGEPLVYHPPIPETSAFSKHLSVAQDAVIHSEFPDVNFNDWHVGGQDSARVLTVDADHWVLLRWDFCSCAGKRAENAGLLELTTYSVLRGGDYIAPYGWDLGMEFDKVRVIEIPGGDPNWQQQNVTYNDFINGQDLSQVFNGQMIYDFEPQETRDSRNFITISRPVMQRLLDGTTKGLLLRPLGAIHASFYDSQNKSAAGPKLHFNVIQR